MARRLVDIISDAISGPKSEQERRAAAQKALDLCHTHDFYQRTGSSTAIPMTGLHAHTIVLDDVAGEGRAPVKPPEPTIDLTPRYETGGHK